MTSFPSNIQLSQLPYNCSYYLEAGGPAGARKLVVDAAQLGVDLEADVAHNLHTAEQHITCIVWVMMIKSGMASPPPAPEDIPVAFWHIFKC